MARGARTSANRITSHSSTPGHPHRNINLSPHCNDSSSSLPAPEIRLAELQKENHALKTLLETYRNHFGLLPTTALVGRGEVMVTVRAMEAASWRLRGSVGKGKGGGRGGGKRGADGEKEDEQRGGRGRRLDGKRESAGGTDVEMDTEGPAAVEPTAHHPLPLPRPSYAAAAQRTPPTGANAAANRRARTL
ncbi:hypothetical protein HK102_003184, partial [Quaeritorhiza haematococci]